MALPVRIPMHIIFGSKKDQLEKQRAKEKAEFEKQKDELRNKATPFYMSGNPEDMSNVCKNVDLEKADEKTKAICAAAKKGGARTRRSKRSKRSGRRKTFKKILRKK